MDGVGLGEGGAEGAYQGGEGGESAGDGGGGGGGVGCLEDAVAEVRTDGVEDGEEGPGSMRR